MTDFTCMERLRADPAVAEILGRLSREIGFDLVQPPGSLPILFEEWDNPYFPAVTAGSIAARIYDLGRQCIPEDFADETSREGTAAVFARMLQKGGTGAAREIALAVSGIAMDGDEAVRAEANSIILDIAAYGLKEKAPEKERRKSSARGAYNTLALKKEDKMAASTIYTHFHFKANRLQDLQNKTKDKPIRVEVVKVVELTEKQFRHFSTHLLEDMPFIIENRDLMREVDGVYHCLLVCVKNHRGGILVESEGYDYARYAADVMDKSALDLRDVPVDHYDLQLRQPHLGPER